jgi:hypothetical protein
MFDGGATGVTIPEEPSLDELLSHVSYTFDPAWAAYYPSGKLSHVQQCAVVHQSLSGTAFDLPMLCALFLLYSAGNGLSRRQADVRRLNAARERVGRPDLLDHIEVRRRFRRRWSTPSAQRRNTAAGARGYTTFADILLDVVTRFFGNCHACAAIQYMEWSDPGPSNCAFTKTTTLTEGVTGVRAAVADQKLRRRRRPVAQRTSGSFLSVSVPCRQQVPRYIRLCPAAEVP